MRIERELMRGAGPLAVMQLLAAGERYRYELVQRLDTDSGGMLAMGQSPLYPMLYNLEAKGLITSRNLETTSGRVRKYDRLTKAGQRQLTDDRAKWGNLVEVMHKPGVTRLVSA